MRVLIAVFALLALLDGALAIGQSINHHRHARRDHQSIDQSVNQSIDQTLYQSLKGRPYQVSYDERAITINGERVLLLSGSIHYPRAPVSEWAPLFKSAREAGLNTIQTYVFWNEHEDVQGELDFETESRNLAQFLQGAQDAGLFINLRIGPYVCAEWYYGGLPLWLRNNQSIQFRYDDPLWLNPVQEWITYVTKYVEPYLARNGGPIMLAQIENEYGGAGSDPHRQNYIWWCGNLTQTLDIEVPWVMCQQPDAPAPLIYACNGFYCHDYVAHQQSVVRMPAMWTENWPGWFQHWGEAKPRRPVEDVAYAMTMFIAAGGVYHNYYMWYGGTTYGKRQGGPGDLPSYDYDAPIDEYGIPHAPKYNHLAENHESINQFRHSILGNEYAKPVDLGNNCVSYSYQPINKYDGVIFAANNNPSANQSVSINGKQFDLPAWSVTIINQSTNQIVFNTRQFSQSTNDATIAYEKLLAKPVWSIRPSSINQLDESINQSINDMTHIGPLEQLSFTLYQSMYLYYSTSININSKQSIKQSINQSLNLSISDAGDYFYVFIDETLVARHGGVGDMTALLIDVSNFTTGPHVLRICVVLTGIENGASYNSWERKGINGDVWIDGLSLINQSWNHSIGLWGERNYVYDPAVAHPWKPINQSINQSWRWYELSFKLPDLTDQSINAPSINATYYLSMNGVLRGQAYMNGRFLSPYWPEMLASESGCDSCQDYGGTYTNTMCRFDCGKPSQITYQVPRDWLLLSADGVQRVVVFNEFGGSVTGITMSRRT